MAYGFARVRWPGRDAVFTLVLATLILPGFVTFIPLYLIFKESKLDQFRICPLVVPTFFANPFFIFMLRQFFMTCPKSSPMPHGSMGPRNFASSRRSSAVGAPGTGDCGALSVYRQLERLFRPADLYQRQGPLHNLAGHCQHACQLWLFQFCLDHGGHLYECVADHSSLFFFAQRTFIEGITLTGLKG